MLNANASSFCPPPTHVADWSLAEFGQAELGDDRRTKRLLMIATAFAQQPTAPKQHLPSSLKAANTVAMITLIVGTNRPASNTRKVAAQVEEIYAELKVPLRVLDLAQMPPEIFSPNSYAEKPESFQPFAAAVLESSGLHVITPEYNGGIPGVLKYFIDMLKFPESFERRPVCFTGLAAGIWGALRPVEQLQAIFGYRNAYLYPERVFLPQINNLLDASGRLKDAEFLGRLKKQAEGFLGFVERLQGTKLRGAKA